ncbi:MAG: flavin reductase family protein [Actinomycetota bacterium]|nr:flavin reductase family protein [Actinomycetota bacterium]
MAAPGGTGPVGPFPERIGADPNAQEEYDKLRRRVLWTMPYGLYALGSRAHIGGADTRNMMTINWVTQLSFEPKMIGVSIERSALTHELVSAAQVFSLCTVDREDRAIVRKFTKPVEVDLDAMTLNGFTFHDGVTGVPILDQAPAFVDCAVQQVVDLGNHTLFVGQVVDCGFQKSEDTPVLRMEDTRMNYGG